MVEKAMLRTTARDGSRRSGVEIFKALSSSDQSLRDYEDRI